MNAIVHAGRDHALLSASSSHRWLICTPSARLEMGFPDTPSDYAREGTLAHELAEVKLRLAMDEITQQKAEVVLKQLRQHELYSPDMEEYVQIYVDIVLERINTAATISPDVKVILEQRLDYSPWVPLGFGTGDAVIIGDGVLEIVDLKFGKGVTVEAEGNTQMRLYALGAIHLFGDLYEVGMVRMTIVQPRLNAVTTDEISAEELLRWADEYVRPRAELAARGEGELMAGEHCRFCRARYTCRALAEWNLELAKYDFKAPELLTDEEVAEVLEQAESLARWVADVQDYALDQAVNHGKKWPGWKLVEGRSNRRYKDEATAAQILLSEGYGEDEIYQKSLKGISVMEKMLGKKRFAELLGEYVEKPPGKPTLVRQDDKRPELNSIEAAIQDFQD